MALHTLHYLHLIISSQYFFTSHSAKKCFCSFESTVPSTNDHFKPSRSKLNNIATVHYEDMPLSLIALWVYTLCRQEKTLNMKGLHKSTKSHMYTYCHILDLLNYLCVARKPGGNIIICEFLQPVLDCIHNESKYDILYICMTTYCCW